MIERHIHSPTPFRRDMIARAMAAQGRRDAGVDLPRPDSRQPTPALSLVERPIVHDSLHARPVTLRDLSILAVDDDPTTLELIEMVFEGPGVAAVDLVGTALVGPRTPAALLGSQIILRVAGLLATGLGD